VINRRRLGRAPRLAPAVSTHLAVLLPGAGVGEWELLRPAAPLSPGAPGDLTEQIFASLDAAARQLVPGEPFALEVPLDLGLIQRFVLPLAEPAEIEEMARIQLEKILPYPAETVGLAFAEVSRGETEVILAVEALHYDRLVMLCEPLTSRGCWPARVLFHARAVAEAVGETTPFICGESGKFVLGIAEAGRLSFAQALSGAGPAEIAAELPAVLLGAELEGLPTNFAVVRLDARCEESRAALEVSLGMPVEMFDAAAAAVPSALATTGDLSPPAWRTERLRMERAARLKKRILAIAGTYVGLLVLAMLALAGLKLRLMWLESRLAAVQPASNAVQAGQVRWKNLGPAIDPSHYLIETLKQVCECLPPGDTIRLTNFEASLNDITTIQGEAPSAAAAVEFTEKLKARPELHRFRLQADPPAVLPNGHASFRIKGTTSAGADVF
jgi:hypothetical protein